MTAEVWEFNDGDVHDADVSLLYLRLYKFKKEGGRQLFAEFAVRADMVAGGMDGWRALTQEVDKLVEGGWDKLK